MPTMQSRIAEYERMYGQAHPGKRMSEREFDEWIEEKTRAEWIDGEVEIMAPVSTEHDDVVGWLRSVLGVYVRHHDLGVVHGPEVLVRLATIRRKRLPDILFVSKARRSIVGTNEVDGAPDLMMEVVSPDSAERDWVRKFEDFQRAGVREYWIIDRDEQRVEAHALSADGRYQKVRLRSGKLGSKAVRGFYLRPEWLLSSPLPSPLLVLKELGVD